MAENLQLCALRLRPSTVATYERFAKAVDGRPSQVMRAILEAGEPYILRTAVRVERARASGRVTPLSLGALMVGVISDLASAGRSSRLMVEIEPEEVQDGESKTG